MTVPSTTRRAGPFTGTGALVSYPFAFKVFAKEDLGVTTADTNGLETAQVLDSGFIVTLNSDQDASPGGSLFYAIGGVPTALPSGYRLAIDGSGLEYEQTADLPQGGNFSPVVVENALDRAMMLLQNLREAVARSLQVGATSADSLALPAPVAYQLLGWNATLDGIVNYAPDADGAAGLQARLANPGSAVDGAALVALNLALNYAGSPDDTVGAFLFSQYGLLAAETSATLTVTNYSYPVGRMERYGGGPGAAAATNTSVLNKLLASSIQNIELQAGQTYQFNGRITLGSNKNIKTWGGPGKATMSFPGVLGGGEVYLVYGTGISNTNITDVHVLGDATQFVNNGSDTYCVHIAASSNVHLLRVSAEAAENGVVMRNGCSDSSMIDCHGVDCFYHAVASWGSSGSPNVRMKLHNLRGYSTQNNFNTAAITGVFFDYTEDSDIYNITGYGTRIGVRLEHSRDNEVSHIRGYTCWQSGIILYNGAQRNNITNVRAWDNNRANQDAIDSTLRGNDNTFFSGVDISATSDNNNITNMLAYQTNGTKIPFNSGSDEPWLGSLIRGATSLATARVRRIELTSGSWGGGNAAGVMHCCEASGAFNASEIIENRTARIPYNSGGVKPSPGDTLTGATSGATGVLLWVSQQSDSTTDWSIDNSAGYMYVVSVTGTFNVAENLNNTTTGTSNIATTNGATVALDSDIATTNGATTLGHLNSNGTYGRGFQKYGIGINVRNLGGANNADGNNILTGVQCFNNDIDQISDRGVYTRISQVNDAVFGIQRSAA